MKTINKFKIFWAIVCTLAAIALCIAVTNEWKAQGVTMPFSLVAGCLFYCILCIGLYVFGKDVAEWFDYQLGNGDEYYKGRRK